MGKLEKGLRSLAVKIYESRACVHGSFCMSISKPVFAFVELSSHNDGCCVNWMQSVTP